MSIRDVRYDPGHVVLVDQGSHIMYIRRETGEFVELSLWSYFHASIKKARVGGPVMLMYSPSRESVPGRSRLVGAVPGREWSR